MKNKLFTLAAALTLAAVIGGVYAAPALAAVIKAALVKNVDEKGRVPFQQTLADGVCPSVAADKRLVVEHLSGKIRATGTGSLTSFRLSVNATVHFYLELTNRLTVLGDTSYTVDSPQLIYLNPGDTCSTGALVDSLGATTTEFTFSGYLVDLTI